MRKRFEQQLAIDITPIKDVIIPTNCRDALPAILKGLHHIYTTPELNARVCELLSEKICRPKKATGRPGMGLWEIFVMAQVRLGLNASYDRVQDLANHHGLMRSVMGIAPNDYRIGKQYEYQNVYDNITLLDDKSLGKINDIIVAAGHGVFKKKEQEPLRIKTDSFVVESNIHHPTDYNLLWDSGRKCLDTLAHIIKTHPQVSGWRKITDWHRSLKNRMRQLGQVSTSGGKNKQERLEQAAISYLDKAEALSRKIHWQKEQLPCSELKDVSRLFQLDFFLKMLDKHIDLVARRLLKGEQIPHEEKIFSIFETYTQLIIKGKQRPPVEFGEKLLVSTDQYGLIVDFDLIANKADVTQTVPLADRLLSRYTIESLSFDKGFWSKEDKELLLLFIPQVIMPKKGKLSAEEKQTESQTKFKALRHAHSAVESNINELEHRGLDRCPDKGHRNFKRYVALGICAYNLHKIGKQLIKQEKAATQKAHERQARLQQAA